MIGSDCDRAAVLRDAGEPAKLDGVDVDVVFRDGHVPQDFNDTRLALRSTTALVLTSAVGDVRRGSSVLEGTSQSMSPRLRGTRYVVQDVEDDGAGISMLILSGTPNG